MDTLLDNDEKPSLLSVSPVSMEAALVMADKKKKRTSRGRQKIPMRRIEDPNHRHVTFSKRRKGLFGKAAELSAACGAHAAVLAFSPGGRPFAFGHPSVDAVLRAFLLGGLKARAEEPYDGAGLEELRRRAQDAEELQRLALEEGDERARGPHGESELRELERWVEELEEMRRLVVAKAEECARARGEAAAAAVHEASVAMMKDLGVATGTLYDIPAWARD